MIRLDILSDPICPWCYIGKARLDRALESRAAHPFAVEWHPFQLNPDMPPQGMDRRAYMEAKFGGKDAAVAAYLPVTQHAEAMGLPLHLDRIRRTPNTLDAHRLIHWAGLEQRQAAVVSALFRAYFQDGRDIGDAAVLADVAATSGLDPALISRLLASDADSAAISARDAHARSRGVGAVPTFIIAERYVVSGAQSVETWMKIIDEIVEKSKDPVL